MIKPMVLNKNDIVAIFAPSRHIGGFEKVIEAGINLIEDEGFRVRRTKSLTWHYGEAAGKPLDRSKEFMSLVKDPSIKVIWAALGGDACNQLLPLLDYKAIASNPKIIIGFSDITTLLLAIHHKSNLVTFHGPNVNNLASIDRSSVNFLLDMLTSHNQNVEYPSFDVIRHGLAKGKLIGGNLFIVNSLLATPYSPSFDETILFIEDVEEGMHTFEYQLYQLKNSGVLSKINGLIIGHIDQWNDTKRSISDLVLAVIGNRDIPIIRANYFGHHCKAFYTMPNGALAYLDTQKLILNINYGREA